MNQKKKNKSGASWGLLIILIPILMRALDGDIPFPAFVVLALGLVIVLAAAGAKKKSGANAKPGAGTSAPAPAPARRTPEVELHRPAPSMQRREPVTAQRSFPQPDAYCVTCENTGEDHFVRDRQRRIAQLDEWLKNGLVDRQEYLVLKRRFENDQ